MGILAFDIWEYLGTLTLALQTIGVLVLRDGQVGGDEAGGRDGSAQRKLAAEMAPHQSLPPASCPLERTDG